MQTSTMPLRIFTFVYFSLLPFSRLPCFSKHRHDPSIESGTDRFSFHFSRSYDQRFKSIVITFSSSVAKLNVLLFFLNTLSRSFRYNNYSRNIECTFFWKKCELLCSARTGAFFIIKRLQNVYIPPPSLSKANLINRSRMFKQNLNLQKSTECSIWLKYSMHSFVFSRARVNLKLNLKLSFKDTSV